MDGRLTSASKNFFDVAGLQNSESRTSTMDSRKSVEIESFNTFLKVAFLNDEIYSTFKSLKLCKLFQHFSNLERIWRMKTKQSSNKITHSYNVFGGSRGT